MAVHADTTDDDQVRAAVGEAATALGRLDVVVNAPPAGHAEPDAGLAGLDDEDFLHQVDTKALGYVRVVRAPRPIAAARRRRGWSTSAA